MHPIAAELPPRSLDAMILARYHKDDPRLRCPLAVGLDALGCRTDPFPSAATVALGILAARHGRVAAFNRWQRFPWWRTWLAWRHRRTYAPLETAARDFIVAWDGDTLDREWLLRACGRSRVRKLHLRENEWVKVGLLAHTGSIK